MDYNFRDIEKKWQQRWKDSHIYQVSNDSNKPKYYVLDMFPYPSGAGLHVGHPLGYIASDVFARYKRLQGFNVLHPMGFDAFGLPAEQYAIETGQHPAETTEKNIATFKKQMDNIGFCFDWSREVRTSDPKYYHWTQWIFLQLFHSWYNRKEDKAQPIDLLINVFEKEGNQNHPCPGNEETQFTAEEWKAYSEKQQQDILMDYRLAYSGVGEVNWCEALGTVLANDEVVNGVSERGGYPVVRKKLRQWYLRITEYADRLLEGLHQVEFSQAMKEMQSNWIGKSEGTEINFPLSNSPHRGENPIHSSHQDQKQSHRGENPIHSSHQDQKQSHRGDNPIHSSHQDQQSHRGDNPIHSSHQDQKQPHRGENPIHSSHQDPKQSHRGENSIHSSQDNEKSPGQGYAEYKMASAKSFENAKKNRKDPTEAEQVLWNALSNRATGYKFRRQHPIENYIVDFACLHAWLIVEVDGGYHTTDAQKEADKTKDKELKKLGFTVLRFTNEDILFNIEETVRIIKNKCDDLTSKLTKDKEPSPLGERRMRVFTTRPDTLFGVDFMVLAPEHELINTIKTEDRAKEVDEYVAYVKNRSERERMAEKKITGCFTGAYAIHPFTGKEIPIWISEYVLAGYGTGAVMAVPCGDERDHRFAKHFNIPITNIIGDFYNGEEANPTKEAVLQNSGFLNGLKMKEAIPMVIEKLEAEGFGKRKVNYKMRDASFSRQRYWGEPFPIVWENGIARPLDEKELPLELPHVDHYAAGPEGKGPLANIPAWTAKYYETNTMPGYAGSSWYFLRYMDPHNEKTFASREATDYWNQADVYVGGTEHAVGHLLYSRMWTKALYDLGFIGFEEPYKKLINQGKITGDSRLVYRIHGTNTFVSKGLKDQYETDELHVDVNKTNGFILDTTAFKDWKPEYKNAEFILENKQYICGSSIEKMSKSLYNTINPDEVVEEYGADTFRMYEMFLGPIEQSKPWDTKGIEGVSRFLKKLWRLFYDKDQWLVTEETPTDEELRILHRTIKKAAEDTERFSFNTAVSQFMICVNELSASACHKKAVLEPLLILLTPYAPHICEELWYQSGHTESILDAPYPKYQEKYIKESTVNYPVAINGKTRTEMTFDANAEQPEIEAAVLADETVQKWMQDKPLRKMIIVKGRMINVVV